MTIEEAEKFYKRYLGIGFHMGREEWSNYHALQQLNLPDETFAKWDHDLLSDQFNNMWTNLERSWVRHGNILTILSRGRCDYETEVAHLLDEMEKMQCLGLHCKTLVIENMAGRNRYLDDGGVYLICKKTKQQPRMKQVMADLIQSETTKDERFLEAVQRYEDALRRHGKR